VSIVIASSGLRSDSRKAVEFVEFFFAQGLVELHGVLFLLDGRRTVYTPRPYNAGMNQAFSLKMRRPTRAAALAPAYKWRYRPAGSPATRIPRSIR
jgi:hypothetical protein